jgi:Glycosyltransferase family 87
MTNDTSSHVPRWLFPAAQPIALRIAVALLFIVAVGVTAVRIQRTLHVPPAIPEFNQGLTDFHNSVYFPALGLREGYNPYSREYLAHYPTFQLPPYSPAMFWLNYPYSLLPLRVANVIFFTLSCGLVVALAASALVVCRAPLTIVNVLGFASLILLSRPGHVNMLLGQITLMLVLGAVWALELARRRPLVGGLALALTTLKPTFAIPLVWLLFCRRDFRAALAGVLIGTTAALAGLAPIVAHHGWQSVVDSLKEAQSKLDADPMVATKTTWTRIDTAALIGKLVGSEPDHFAVAAIAAVCLLAAGAAVWRVSKTPLAEGADSLSALIICTATLACVYHGVYDALLLVAPWVAVSVGRLREQLPPMLRPVVWLLLTVPAINYFSTRVFIMNVTLEQPLLKPLTMVNSACIAAIFLLSVSVAVRRSFALRAEPQKALITPARS